MDILIFIAVIVVLIVVHEFGHLIAAKWAGMRVDEFGIGYPPRALILGEASGTLYTLNWLPFGGFVKIYGEDGLPLDKLGTPDAFSKKTRLAQALVLVAGVTMNLILAYALITGALIIGTPRALSAEEVPYARDATLAVVRVLPDSPAERAGLLPGDVIRSAEDGHLVFSGVEPSAFTAFIAQGEGNATVALVVKRADGSTETLFARPGKGVILADPSRAALGVEVAAVGTISLPFISAVVEGAKLTWEITRLTAVGLSHFFFSVLTLSADFSQVAGPVGIAGVVGDAGAQGLGTLLSLTAVISINLALINLIPVPALDGGRLFFVIIEGITRRAIKPSVARAVNALGFVFLILLMLVVTAHDIFKIVQ